MVKHISEMVKEFATKMYDDAPMTIKKQWRDSGWVDIETVKKRENKNRILTQGGAA